ncbi:hypothetical protein FUT69_02115 [Xylella taiwanensis]|uniref:Uncharacterized protein n=1 Tax=Xylella taiwanensis TaxID=1444770 RepID=A0ABS8TR58_9GAMM|nr:hypothetical protein [Xylella taiwanensis]MCD8457194.1 hypothetical protein [Xylella taiwanensis]MCD8459603.1 hypothetical protein [Xylella taiwanensis]MCD8461530.1 hypothetical protein [Xylella taiwanensis]MCD8462444.1 hypothetical protein [Xylella taiwanensis]MCD8466227.1 hypothetical protein [Xylella taiwanensis]
MLLSRSREHWNEVKPWPFVTLSYVPLNGCITCFMRVDGRACAGIFSHIMLWCGALELGSGATVRWDAVSNTDGCGEADIREGQS